MAVQLPVGKAFTPNQEIVQKIQNLDHQIEDKTAVVIAQGLLSHHIEETLKGLGTFKSFKNLDPHTRELCWNLRSALDDFLS